MDIPKIKRYLKENGLTYEDLAKMSGIPKQTISRVLGGFTANPRVDTIEAIEHALGFDKITPAVEVNELGQMQLRLLTAFNSLLPAMQESVLGIVENLAAQSGGANADKRGEA